MDDERGRELVVAMSYDIDDAGVVRLPDGRALKLDDDRPERTALVGLLRHLRELGHPVSFDLRPDGGLHRVRIPLVGRVTRIDDVAGGLDIELDTSQVAHRVPAEVASGLDRELRAAFADRVVVILTENEAHRVIDVRPFPDDVTPPPLPPWPEPLRRPTLLLRLLDRLREVLLWPWWPWWLFRSVSQAHANSLFADLAAVSCAPLTVPSPCIPFLYPDDGCWARAHEMRRLLLNKGVLSRKIWITASTGLKAYSKNSPSCVVHWGWHVAPTILVRTSWFPVATRQVIDPSLFTGPVSTATWKGVQGDPGATLVSTDSSQFWRGGGTDPSYTDTAYYLALYRSALQARSLQPGGPPPYAYC